VFGAIRFSSLPCFSLLRKNKKKTPNSKHPIPFYKETLTPHIFNLCLIHAHTKSILLCLWVFKQGQTLFESLYCLSFRTTLLPGKLSVLDSGGALFLDEIPLFFSYLGCFLLCDISLRTFYTLYCHLI